MELYSWDERQIFQCRESNDHFWRSVGIWIYKPNALNKKIGGVDFFYVGLLTIEELRLCIKHFRENLFSLNCILGVKEAVQRLVNKFTDCFERSNDLNQTYEVNLRYLYPKSGQYLPDNVELLVKDCTNNSIIFMKPVNGVKRILTCNVPYAISFDEENIFLYTMGKAEEDVAWLSGKLIPKLISWMNTDCSTSISSNKLVALDKYLAIYCKLKEKYFHSVSQFWSESTNPEKFITEDIAIATYLIVLWNGKCQNFVDLGCGNGLLVYILNSEGHKGFGIDVRARKIWNSYPDPKVLKEATLSPSLDITFPETEWIIGNHSDELTPWIPVIAAKSSYKTKFLLLPCCPYEFDGKKYIRCNTSKSTYLDYMDYLEQICIVCGIKPERDRLKIPSTKRICFIGRERLYAMSEQPIQEQNIEDFVKTKITSDGQIKVKLRNYEEEVKNCTQLDREFLKDVVFDIANFIIKTSPPNNSWREGEYVELSEIIKLLSSEKKNILKAQCGGLQTLLKNHHHIFLLWKGKVKLKKPTEKILLPKVVKKKDCWFFLNHPDSCPLSDEKCTYIHSR